MMGQVLSFWRDDGISIPPRPRRIEPDGPEPEGNVVGFLLIYTFAFIFGVVMGVMFS